MPDVLPTTDIERAFWHYDRNSVSNCTVAVRWKGAGSPELLRRAFGDVAARHPYLSHLWSRDGSVLEPRDEALWGWDSQLGGEDRWLDLVEIEIHRPFDLIQGPLVRATVLWTAEPGFVLVVTLPHLISDGVGINQFTREILDRLDSLLSGSVEALPPYRFLRPSSSDFDLRRCQSSSWTWVDPKGSSTRLSAEAPRAESGTAIASTPTEPGRSSLLVETLAPETTQELLAACSRSGVSLNAWLTASLVLTFWGYLRQRGLDSVLKVASTVSYRNLLRTQGLSPMDLGLWAGRFHLWAQLSEGTDPVDLAKAFQSGLFHTLRQSAFSEMASFARGVFPGTVSGAGWFPYVKVTNLGDLDAQGLSRPFLHGEAARFQGFTALHRGWVNDQGWGLIASVFRGRLQLCFVSRNPGMDPGQARMLADRYLQILSGS